MSNAKNHWENVYSENAPDEVSWYQTAHEKSLRLIEQTGVGREEWIIDVGAGASTLADQLIAHGFKRIALLDVSSRALAYTKRRLGDFAQQIEWIETDIKDFSLPNGGGLRAESSCWASLARRALL